MPVDVLKLFALTVFSSKKLDGFEEHRKALIDRIDLLRANKRGMQASNQHAFHSERDFLVAQDDATRWLKASLIAFAEEALKPMLTTTKPWEAFVSHCWALAADKGGWLVPHNHFPAPWAGVVYLEAAHSISPDPQDTAGRLELLCPIPLAEVFGLQSGATVAPLDGHIVMFPGALQHVVHPHRTERTRYSVSFNLAIRPKG